MSECGEYLDHVAGERFGQPAWPVALPTLEDCPGANEKAVTTSRLSLCFSSRRSDGQGCCGEVPPTRPQGADDAQALWATCSAQLIAGSFSGSPSIFSDSVTMFAPRDLAFSSMASTAPQKKV